MIGVHAVSQAGGAALALSLFLGGSVEPPEAPPVEPTKPTAPAPGGGVRPGMSAAGVRQSTGEAPPLQMRVAVAPALARQPGWYREFHCATRRAGRLLRGALGRDLRLRDRVTWSGARDSEGLAELLARLVGGIGHEGADIVVGLVPRSTPRRRADPIMRDHGEASYAQGYVVLRAAAPLCEADRLLAHEIAHVFGGVHRRGSDNLMDPDVPGTRVDELNAALFDLHRGRLVRAQAPPLRGEALRMMWRLSGADTAAADTWLRVGVLAARMGDPAAASRHYERALAIAPQLRTAWVNLGHARLQAGSLAGSAEAYFEALALDPNDGVVHHNLAIIYLSTDRPKQARASINRAIELGEEISPRLRSAIRAAGGG